MHRTPLCVIFASLGVVCGVSYLSFVGCGCSFLMLFLHLHNASKSHSFWARLKASKTLRRALSPIKPTAGPGLLGLGSPGFKALSWALHITTPYSDASPIVPHISQHSLLSHPTTPNCKHYHHSLHQQHCHPKLAIISIPLPCLKTHRTM